MSKNSFDVLESAGTGYNNIVRKVVELLANPDGEKDENVYNTWHDKILTPVSDNLKTAESLVVFQDLLKDKSVNNTTKLALVKFVDDLLGLEFVQHAQKIRELETLVAPHEIQEMAQKRLEAKKSRDFATADELRNQIDSAGWSVMDTPDGYKLVKK